MTEERKFEFHAAYGDTEEVELNVALYEDNDNLYVGLSYYDPELQAMDYYTDATVNIIRLPYLHAAIDTNNGGQEMADFLVENNLAHPVGASLPSGYCLFPVYEFNAEALMEADPRGFAEYQKAHGIEPQEASKEAKHTSVSDLSKEAKGRAADKNAQRDVQGQPSKRQGPER